MVLSPGSDWLVAEPNPEAGWLPASWKKAVIAGVGKTAIEKLIQKQADNGAEIDTAVAYLGGGGKAHFAILPDGFGMLPKSEEHPEDNYAVAMRQGEGPTTFAPCLWRPRDQTILVPAGLFIADQLVPTNPDLANDYRRVPLA